MPPKKKNQKKKKKKKTDSDSDYEVEALLQCRPGGKGEREYLVKWKNYTNDFNTWEPLGNLSNSPTLVREFHEQLGLQVRRS
jgi:hypothetical protein